MLLSVLQIHHSLFTNTQQICQILVKSLKTLFTFSSISQHYDDHLSWSNNNNSCSFTFSFTTISHMYCPFKVWMPVNDLFYCLTSCKKPIENNSLLFEEQWKKKLHNAVKWAYSSKWQILSKHFVQQLYLYMIRANIEEMSARLF